MIREVKMRNDNIRMLEDTLDIFKKGKYIKDAMANRARILIRNIKFSV